MSSHRDKPIDVIVDVRSRLDFRLGRLEDANCVPAGKLTGAMATARADYAP